MNSKFCLLGLQIESSRLWKIYQLHMICTYFPISEIFYKSIQRLKNFETIFASLIQSYWIDPNFRIALIFFIWLNQEKLFSAAKFSVAWEPKYKMAFIQSFLFKKFHYYKTLLYKTRFDRGNFRYYMDLCMDNVFFTVIATPNYTFLESPKRDMKYKGF